MAKESREGKSKLRVFFGFAEVEGSDVSIQDGLRTISAAVTRAAQQPTFPHRVIKALPPSANPTGNGKAAPPGLFDEVDHSNEQVVEDEEEQVLDAEFEPVEQTQEKKQRQARKGVTYTLLGNLDLRPDGKPSLKDYFAEKSPRDQQEQTAVFVYYLSRVLGETKLNVNHLYTCFKQVEKRVPTNILLVARNTANRKGWVDTSDSNDIKTTTQGENFVEHDLPKKDSK